MGWVDGERGGGGVYFCKNILILYNYLFAVFGASPESSQYPFLYAEEERLNPEGKF